MDNDTMTIENRRRENLLEAQKQAQEQTTAENRKENAKAGSWIVAFTAVGLIWIGGLVFSFLIPFATFAINFLAVLGLWMWAKASGLNPPTFATGFKAVGSKVASQAADAVPGTDLLYILSSGTISPIIYLTALWWNNR